VTSLARQRLACCILIAIGVTSMAASAQVPLPSQQPTNRGTDSDRFCQLFPSRVKTFVVSGCDPDDQIVAVYQGNDDGFSGWNGSECYRTVDQGNPLSVIADFAGRPGVLGLFFRNFWSDYSGTAIAAGEDNQTRIWLDGVLAHDQPLTDYFRDEHDPRGQVAPFSGPFTGNRSGGWLTHAQLRWNQSMRLGLWDDSAANASRFHRVAATIASPEGELPVPAMSAWDWIDKHRGSWPHAAARQPQQQALQLAANSAAKVIVNGPATLLELTCRTGQNADWAGLWVRVTWDGERKPAVDLPLRLLGAMVAPPFSFPMQGLLLANDGNLQISNFFPMPFRSGAVIEFVNRNNWPVALQVTTAMQPGVPTSPWGHFHAFYHADTTVTGTAFAGPLLTDCRGTLRMLMLEDGMDTTGRIPNMLMNHLEGDLCVRINGRRGDEHSFDASETSIGRWGWYLRPVDRPFVQDTSFQSGLMLQPLGPATQSRRIMGSTFVFDPIHFVDGIDVRLEHGVQNQANADYSLVAFLYVDSGAARRATQEIDVGDAVAEAANGVQFTQWSSYLRAGNCMRDQFYGDAPIADSVRHVRDFIRFRADHSNDTALQRPLGVGFRLDRLGTTLQVLDADVLVDGQPAGLLHVWSHNALFPWKEGGEAEVELPRSLTDGKRHMTVEVRPRLGSDALNIARIWVYEYSK
jgi:hypothetical protein